MEKKVLTPKEINLEMEKRKKIRRERLGKKIIELTKECDNIDEKLHISDAIGSAFVSIFDRFGVMGYNEHDTIEDAIKSLEYGSDEGLIMDIAIIETSTKKMVWYQKFLGKSECQAKVDRFVKHYL